MLSQRIRVFHAVATRLSYSKAAQELGISQPAVSFHIRGLEEEWVSASSSAWATDFPHHRRPHLVRGRRQDAAPGGRSQNRHHRVRQGLNRGVLVVGASATIGIYLLPEVLGVFRERQVPSR